MDTFLIILTIAGVSVGAAAVGYSRLQAKRASGSILTIADAARQVARGDFDLQVQAPASRSTRELAAAFTNMSQYLGNTFQDLSSERNKLATLLTTMSDGVVVVEGEGRVQMINPAAQALLEVKDDQLKGRRLVEVVRDNTIQQLISECLLTGKPQSGTAEMLRPRRHLSVAAIPLEFGGTREVLLTLHNLTETRQTEISQKEFVSNVSHELRNPLASVKAMVETLEDGAIEESQVAKNFLERIRGDIDRMNKLVDDLLELSRLESGQLILRAETVDLSILIKEIADGFNTTTRQLGITLALQLPDGPLTLTADADRIKQVLINLVDNAIRYTDGGGEVTISATALPEEIQVIVRDTGKGIASEHLPHLFERFYKVDRSRRDGGTGLGLAIVQQIIEAHGGTVWAESVEGEGSTFGFTISTAD